MKVDRPILRFHGGKWILAPWIISNFPEHRVYVEPFGGAGSVLLRKPRAYAEVFNDLDGEVVNLFRVARDYGDELRRVLSMTPYARSEFLASYRKSNNPIEQARRTVVRSFMGFGSNSHDKATGFRNNSNRSGTTPAHDWANYPEALDGIIERLRGIVIENRDALDLMSQMDSVETLHYVDPPYASETRNAGKDYRFEMSDSDHVKLSGFLMGLKGMVVVSGYDCPLYSNLYAGWKRINRKSFADGARPREETLFVNNAAWQVKPQGELI